MTQELLLKSGILIASVINSALSQMKELLEHRNDWSEDHVIDYYM